MQEQLLDAINVEYGILHILAVSGMAQRNVQFGSAVCAALNNWQYEEWTQRDKRLKGSINVQGEDPDAAIAEIERWAGNRDSFRSRCRDAPSSPWGASAIGQCSRPRFATTFRSGSISPAKTAMPPQAQAGPPSTPNITMSRRWRIARSRPVSSSRACSRLSRVLKFVLVEGGFGWVPGWTWRLDKQWARMRDEVPHLKRPPSEYISKNLWFTSQPVEEPENPEDMRSVIDWIGWDRLLIATDYPHWDFDDPELRSGSGCPMPKPEDLLRECQARLRSNLTWRATLSAR